jgi:hypothetical protein
MEFLPRWLAVAAPPVLRVDQARWRGLACVLAGEHTRMAAEVSRSVLRSALNHQYAEQGRQNSH